jgi:hypothetical protein
VIFQGKGSGAFSREQLISTAAKLDIPVLTNVGDILYSFRYRNPLPEGILKTQPKGKEWVIEGTGRAEYEFRLVPINRIAPNDNLITIKIPDATPEIVESNSLWDEQALLAKVRYKRLIDIFLGVSAYCLQNHLRTTVKGMGQIEIDEVYVGVDRTGYNTSFPFRQKVAMTSFPPCRRSKTSPAVQRNFRTLCAELFPRSSSTTQGSRCSNCNWTATALSEQWRSGITVWFPPIRYRKATWMDIASGRLGVDSHHAKICAST